MVELRDTHIQGWIRDLDELAKAFIDAVNALHKQGRGLDGSTNLDFFTGEGAWDIGVAALRPEEVAAAYEDPPTKGLEEPGNGENARRIADLAHTDLLIGSTVMTVDDGMESLLARVGSMGQESSLHVDTQMVT